MAIFNVTKEILPRALTALCEMEFVPGRGYDWMLTQIKEGLFLGDEFFFDNETFCVFSTGGFRRVVANKTFLTFEGRQMTERKEA